MKTSNIYKHYKLISWISLSSMLPYREKWDEISANIRQLMRRLSDSSHQRRRESSRKKCQKTTPRINDTRRRGYAEPICIKNRKIHISCMSHRVHSVPGFLSSELGPPTPSPHKRVLLPPFGSKCGELHARGGGDGGDPIPTKGHTHWYSTYNFSTCMSL